MSDRFRDFRSSFGGARGGNGGAGAGGTRASDLASGFATRLGNAWWGEDREVGQTRAKMRGYIDGIRDTAQQNYSEFTRNFSGVDFDELEASTANAPEDANVTRDPRTGEEMILFPGYSKRHVPKKNDMDNSSNPNVTEKSSSDSSGGQAIQQHWDQIEDQNAIVDVDVRGWIYTPHKGAMNRKQRLMIGIARKIAGIPTIAADAGSPGSGSQDNSRSTSPHPLRHKIEEHNAKKEERIAEEEADYILKKTKEQGEKADRGEYSEGAGEADKIKNKLLEEMKRTDSQDSLDSTISKAQVRATWNQPSNMTPEEAALANTNLMSRLRPFYTQPKIDYPINVFFYNKDQFRKHITRTNTYGQFALRAALDFVPTHVRIMVNEKFSTTQTVEISEAAGISVISDIDDTIKHTGMLSGTREAFRNAFLRNLDDLVIDGVEQWYSKLAEMGVQFHYVSNSPWELFPALSKFFSAVGLPPGSFHLKQYGGMQGLFEPVAERKKSTLDRISRDFPNRYFILIGDSGEADLEVYQDFVRENRGRVLGVFIRDVTTPDDQNKLEFFNSNLGDPGSPRRFSDNSDFEHDPELKAAIEASIKNFEEEDAKRRGSAPSSNLKYGQSADDDLMDFSDPESKAPVPSLPLRPTNSSGKAPPPPPRKPGTLRGNSVAQISTESANLGDAPPPKPPRPSALRSVSAASAPPNAPGNEPQGSKPAVELPPSLPPRRAATINPTEPASKAESTNPSTTYETIASYPIAAASKAANAISSVYPGGTSSPNHSSSNINLSQPGSQLTKAQANRVEMWRRRWETAESFFKKEGVMLRSWRVGTDEMEDSVELVKKGETLIRKMREQNEKLIDF